MANHIENRDKIIDTLRQELMGPAPFGDEIDCEKQLEFAEVNDAFKPVKQYLSGEEIIQNDRPIKRYGIGILYPIKCPEEQESTENQFKTSDLTVEETPDAIIDLNQEKTKHAIEDLIENISKISDESDSDDFDLSRANAFRQSSIAISFLANVPKGARLMVRASGGRYRKKTVIANGRNYTWWLRSLVNIDTEFTAAAICTKGAEKITPDIVNSKNSDDLDIHVEMYSRPYKSESSRLVTVCLVNRSTEAKSIDEYCLFQSTFTVFLNAPDEKYHILPYPKPPVEKMDPEEESLDLLYRKLETFAVGHGCAADWEREPANGRVNWVKAECLPFFETASITPDIIKDNNEKLEVSMAALAGLIDNDNGFKSLKDVINEYEKWIEDIKLEMAKLEDRYKQASAKHIDECEKCLNRMKNGMNYLTNNKQAKSAFKLANQAILLQQIQVQNPRQRANFDSKNKQITYPNEYSAPDTSNPPGGRGKWRPFQIAFLLTAIESAANPKSVERDIVDLIWFPTGGGKTEAYLGLAAFTMFMRRLNNPNDIGVNVLMRYTLRLLTAQQFLRASTLICAMEYIRKQHIVELGKDEFSIGIWLGSSTTPNTWAEAKSALKDLQKSGKPEDNRFLLDHCPWCGTAMGHDWVNSNKPIEKINGYSQAAHTVVFTCPHPGCPFKDGLPIYVIDEDIYSKRPTLIIATIDKFAMLAWRPQARAVFNINPDGKYISSPPDLIIQDELHLISGPLGSMAGLYETVIEELCTYKTGEIRITPKMICSTATIRQSAEQIKSLYARENAVLFPPPGLDISNSFFARYARDKKSKLLRGKIYIGINAPGLSSLQTAQVRTYTALLQAPVPFSPEDRDPWWTLMLFFNSLRELGTTLSLLQADIPDRLKIIRRRTGLNIKEIRNIVFKPPLELSSRLSNSKVTDVMEDLKIHCLDKDKRAVDVCLASNIIEVGIDIDRLSLLCVTGQPKTTSQYIQVTGRVGRRWWERPGLIVTIYSPTKPRDRSHFEKFRSYHERLYASVEPTSVTPFSPAVMDRCVHALMALYTRQIGSEEGIGKHPFPYPDKLINNLQSILMDRIQKVDPQHKDDLNRVFNLRIKQWKQWNRTRWSGIGKNDEFPLLRETGAYADPAYREISWPTPMSMRNVDAECEADITLNYIKADNND